MVAASVRNPLAKLRTVSLDVLETADWVLPGPASRSRQALEGEFLQLGRSPPLQAVEVTSFVYGLALVARTSMLTVAPVTAVRSHEKAGGVKRLTTPLQFLPYAVHWITRRDSGASELLGEMGDWVKRRLPRG